MHPSLLHTVASGGMAGDVPTFSIALSMMAVLMTYAVLRLPRWAAGRDVRCRSDHSLAGAALIAMCLLTASAHAGVVDFSAGLLRYVGERWGREAPVRLQHWQQLVKSAQIPPVIANPRFDQNLLERVNAFWNRTPYFSDQAHWGMPEYWATPVETQGSNGGDCEDYAFGKYFTLRELGMPARNLRITYVRASGWDVSHMVLAYYPEVDADPLILDNLTSEILPASRRTDLQPVYSFNDEDLWTAGTNVRQGQAGQIRLWRELLEKMAREQRM